MKAYLLLDRSGSMSNIWDETLRSVNSYAKSLDAKATVSVIAFDDQGFDVVRDNAVGFWSDITPATIHPRGNTPLFDSLARLIGVATKNNDPKTVVVVVTDGYENCSRNTTREQIDAMIKRCEAREWPVIFLGANFKDVYSATQSYTDSVDTVRSTRVLRKGHMTNNMVELASATTGYWDTGNRSRLYE